MVDQVYGIWWKVTRVDEDWRELTKAETSFFRMVLQMTAAQIDYMTKVAVIQIVPL